MIFDSAEPGSVFPQIQLASDLSTIQLHVAPNQHPQASTIFNKIRQTLRFVRYSPSFGTITIDCRPGREPTLEQGYPDYHYMLQDVGTTHPLMIILKTLEEKKVFSAHILKPVRDYISETHHTILANRQLIIQLQQILTANRELQNELNMTQPHAARHMQEIERMIDSEWLDQIILHVEEAFLQHSYLDSIRPHFLSIFIANEKIKNRTQLDPQSVVNTKLNVLTNSVDALISSHAQQLKENTAVVSLRLFTPAAQTYQHDSNNYPKRFLLPTCRALDTAAGRRYLQDDHINLNMEDQWQTALARGNFHGSQPQSKNSGGVHSHSLFATTVRNSSNSLACSAPIQKATF